MTPLPIQFEPLLRMEPIIEIAGLRIAVDVSPAFGETLLTAAYQPFLRQYGDERDVGGLLLVADAARSGSGNGEFPGEEVAAGFNDVGESRLFFDGSRYTVGISPMPGMEMRYMRFAPDFSSAVLRLVPGEAFNSFLLDSMLRIFFSQTAVVSGAFLLHASAVETERGAHLFLGRSGTGKSTHSALWLRTFSDCRLLNDDNPLVRVRRDGTVSVSGTPWSGKTPCWRGREVPLLSMTRLRRAAENRYTPLSDVDAFVAAMPGVSVLVHSARLYDMACAALSLAVEKTAVGILDCLPDREAAVICRRNVEPDKNDKTDNNNIKQK